MRILDSVLTVLVFVPFSLLVLFFLLSLLRNTVQNQDKPDSWKAAGALGGVLLLQIGGAVLVGFCLYLIFFAGTGF